MQFHVNRLNSILGLELHCSYITVHYLECDLLFVCIRLCDQNEDKFELLEKLEMDGAVEGAAFAKVLDNLFDIKEKFF